MPPISCPPPPRPTDGTRIDGTWGDHISASGRVWGWDKALQGLIHRDRP